MRLTDECICGENVFLPESKYSFKRGVTCNSRCGFTVVNGYRTLVKIATAMGILDAQRQGHPNPTEYVKEHLKLNPAIQGYSDTLIDELAVEVIADQEKDDK